ncbi:uncharacterized protein LOC118807655 [Colossoma macropomum]|uniref:uncharacterized protein LOC118807655 n=1 Tax=Colossoma macropomum TaxID=42526 RepID=UPI001864A341|nr:uncharacterized protein LOC118807655 [Colossoma macropomum]
MASSFVPVTNTRNGFTIVTQVVPGGTEQYGLGAGGGVSVKKLLEGEPKALGTVQIMIGIMTLLFGIIKTVYVPHVGAYTGVTYWGSCFYITSGSLSVAAGNRADTCVVRSSLVMNIISAVTAGVAIVLLSFDMFCQLKRSLYFCSDQDSYEDYCEMLSGGISGVLLVFSLLEFIISICTSVFTYKATHCAGAPISQMLSPRPFYHPGPAQVPQSSYSSTTEVLHASRYMHCTQQVTAHTIKSRATGGNSSSTSFSRLLLSLLFTALSMSVRVLFMCITQGPQGSSTGTCAGVQLLLSSGGLQGVSTLRDPKALGLVFRMASHVIPVENAGNGFTIFTHVIPPQTAPGGLQEVSTLREPKALGTVQILIGIMTYLFGIVSAVHFDTVSGYSNISRWGSMIYISSGALTVAAANQPHPFVVRSSLVMNIISAVAAGVAIVLLSIDMCPFLHYHFNFQALSYGVWSVSRGISGVLLVFSVLQFIVSIFTSVFACKATCTACCAGAPAVFIISNPETQSG